MLGALRRSLTPGHLVLVCVAVGLLWTVVALDRTLYYLSYGLLARFSPLPVDDSRIVLVALDDESLDDARLPHWGPGVLSRKAHARVVREATGGGAKVIGFDIAFIDPSPDDAELRAALDESRTTVLVEEGEPGGVSGKRRFVQPSELLVTSPSVRLASPIIRKTAATGQVIGVEMEQALDDGGTLNALSFECYKAARQQDDLAASLSYGTVGSNRMMPVRYPAGKPEQWFPTVSLRDVWDGSWRKRAPELFRRKIVLVGSFQRMGHADLFRIPTGWTVPGVLVHACALQTLVGGVPAEPRGIRWGLVALGVLVPGLAVLKLRPGGAAAAALVGAALLIGACVVLFRQGYWFDPITPVLAMLPVLLTGLVARSAFFGRMLERYAGSEAGRQLISTGRVRTETRRATVLFADVRGYTHLSEKLEPAEVMKVLNDHFEWVDGIIDKHGGRVDKHIGDAVMAVFEGSRRGGGHARRALAAGEEMVRGAAERQGSAAELRFGVGIHTGDITTGELGQRKTEYGTIGDAVNVAARLEQATRTFSEPLLASEDTIREAGAGAGLRSLGEVSLKGRTGALVVYALARDGKALET